jgi:hypothetical protein
MLAALLIESRFQHRRENTLQDKEGWLQEGILLGTEDGLKKLAPQKRRYY